MALIDAGEGGAPIAAADAALSRGSSWEDEEARREADRQPLPPQLRGPGRAPGRSACRTRANAALPASSTSRPASANGATSSPSPSASPTSGPASASIRTRPTPIPTSAPRRWSKAADHPRVIAIGECGLDYYYDKSDRAAQRERFEAHIEAARQTGLPLVVHTRDAEEDTAEILEPRGEGGGRHRRAPLLHRHRPSSRARALDLGFYVSLSGIVTFKNAARPAGDRQMAARRPDAGRDRFALPRAGSAPRAEVRAGVRRRHRRVRRRAAGRGARRAGRSDHRQFLQTCSEGRREGPDSRLRDVDRAFPKIGNDWGQCDPAEPRNARLRTSILVESAGERMLVDCGPDLRQQLLAARGRPARRGDRHPRPWRPLPRHRRAAAGGAGDRRPGAAPCARRGARRAAGALRLCLRADRFLPPDRRGRASSATNCVRRCARRASSTSRTAARPRSACASTKANARSLMPSISVI